MSILALLACTPSPDPEIGVGDPERGWEALRYGDYVGSGVPADVWFDLVPASEGNVLDREGRSADLSASFNLFAAPNGVEVVGGLTCFGCHAATIEGTFVPGIGNPRIDFASNDDGLFDVLGSLIDARYGAESPESEAFAPLQRGIAVVSPYTVTPFAGVNPAFSLERAAVAHRDPQTLAWVDTPLYEVPQEPLWSDTPPLWHLKKRSRLYWTGFGIGEVDRMLMQIGVVGLFDTDQADAILTDFPDIRAWITALDPPPYPRDVDDGVAAAGQIVFEAHCAGCHGTYGASPTFPEVFVPADEIGTDPAYALGFIDTPFIDWVAESWFGRGTVLSESDYPDVAGYVAPPLDGIWATAPYLHNGSVPDLAALLDPETRPPLWRRDPIDTSLDHDRMGWPYTVPEADAVDTWTYDVAVAGADNGGHRYGEVLTEAERTEVLAYLKTL